MSNIKKRKYNDDYQSFNEKWLVKYFFFIEFNGKATYLACHEKKVSVFKEFNIKRHYKSKDQVKFAY